MNNNLIHTRKFWIIIICFLLLVALSHYLLILQSTTPSSFGDHLFWVNFALGGMMFSMIGNAIGGLAVSYLFLLVYYTLLAYLATKTLQTERVLLRYPLLFTIVLLTGMLFNFGFQGF